MIVDFCTTELYTEIFLSTLTFFLSKIQLNLNLMFKFYMKNHHNKTVLTNQCFVHTPVTNNKWWWNGLNWSFEK